MKKIKEIAEGWYNVLKKRMDRLSPVQREESARRLNICAVCPVRSGGICDPKKRDHHAKTLELTRGCGCIIEAKVLSSGSSCPLGKW